MDRDLAARLKRDLLAAFEQTRDPIFSDAEQHVPSNEQSPGEEIEIAQIIHDACLRAFGPAGLDGLRDQSREFPTRWLSPGTRKLMGLPARRGRRRNAQAFRLHYMGIWMIERDSINVTAAAKAALPDAGQAGLDSKRDTLEKNYRQRQDFPWFKFVTALFYELYARSSFAGKFDDPQLLLIGVLEQLHRLGLDDRLVSSDIGIT